MQSGGLEASHATQCEPESSRHQVKRSLEACVASADSQRAGKAHKAAASGCSGAGMVDVTKLERANLERAYLDLNVQARQACLSTAEARLETHRANEQLERNTTLVTEHEATITQLQQSAAEHQSQLEDMRQQVVTANRQLAQLESSTAAALKAETVSSKENQKLELIAASIEAFGAGVQHTRNSEMVKMRKQHELTVLESMNEALEDAAEARKIDAARSSRNYARAIRGIED